MLVVSSRLGPYEIVAPLGAGGMGEVYRARDTRLGREVAIKVLPEQFAHDERRLERFEREVRAVAALSHPNIMAIHDVGTHEGITYAVMELLEGETLGGRLNKGPLPWREAVEVGAVIAEGLAAAHAKGIVHRDLKPENLFLTTDGQVKILDFGLARITPLPITQGETGPYVPAETEAGTVMGTVGYMSPEQVRGQPADARSDLFSFGCVLYEMVTGRRAFRRDTAAETMTAILHDEPTDPTASGVQLSAELGRLIRQCLAKNPNARLQSARDLALGLRAAATDPALHQPPTARRSSRRLVVILAAVLLIGGISASAYLLTRDPRPSGSGRPSPEAEAADALAVLPFENIGGDPKTEYLSDGLADHLINSLSQVRRQDLKVRPFNSVARFKGQRPDAPTLGRELKVRVFVTGTLHQQGDNLSIRVALVDAGEDSQIWGQSYRGKLGGILDLQDQIARDVAANLKLGLTGEEDKRLTKRSTADPDAYLLYREAVYHVNKFTEAGLETAIDYCRRALKKDPNYALAYVGLGRCYHVLGAIHRGLRQTRDEARQNYRRALSIDDSLAEAHIGLAVLYQMHDWDWPAAQRELDIAIALNPADADAWVIYCFQMGAQGKLPEAFAKIQRGQELDPAPSSNALVMCLNWMRRYDEAIAESRITLKLDPNFPLAYSELALAYVAKGMPAEAIAELQTAQNNGHLHPRVKGMLGYAYASAAKRPEALGVLDELLALAPGRYGYALPIARIHAALGEKDQAFEWLRKACDERDSAVIWIKVDPTLDSLRSDPRFDALVSRMGLADKAAGRDQSTRSVAVLPFLNVGGDPKSEFLSDGVADQIINNLSQVRRADLKVRPFTSVVRYKGKEPDLPSFGRELNVQMIVTGRLQQAGDDLIIHVAVVDVKEETQLWGNTYRGKRDAILDLQDRIARDVAVNLRLRLTGEEEQRLTKRYTQDPEAYLLFREGTYHWNKFSPDGIQTGIEYFQRAIKKDPNYALAYAGLGRSYNLLGSMHLGPRQTHAEAKKNLNRALEIDNTLLAAHSGLGLVTMFHDRDWPKAERHLQQAFDLNSSTPAENWYGFYLAAMGRTSDALVYIRRCHEADPLAARGRNELAMCYNWMRQHDRATAEAQKALELDANFPIAYAELGTAYVLQGKYEEAIARMQKELDRGQKHPRVLGMLAYACAAAGKKAEAHKVLIELKQFALVRYGFALSIARTHAALGEKDQAFEWLRKSCDERDSQVIWIKVDPTLDNLRSDPRFTQVLKDMGLPQ